MRNALLVVPAVLLALALILGVLPWMVGSQALRPGLESLLSQRSGLTATIDGQLDWQYLWPTAVTISGVRAIDEAPGGTLREAWTLDELRLELTTASVLLAPADPSRWEVQAFQVSGLRGERGAVGTEQSERFAVPDFWIRSLRAGSPAPFAARVSYRTPNLEPIEISLGGRLRFVPAERRMQFPELKLGGNLIQGRCSADLALKTASERPLPATATTTAALRPLLDLPRWRRTDWQLDCALDSLTLAAERFTGLSLASRNDAGAASLKLTAPDVFGGAVQLSVNIDAGLNRSTPTWRLQPQVEGVNSRRLLDWAAAAGARMQAGGDTSPDALLWDGPINLAGELRSEGNSRARFLTRSKGTLTLVSNDGLLDLAEFKRQASEPLEKAGAVLGETNLLGSWPDRLRYEALLGRWEVQGHAQTFSGQLDNLTLSGIGELIPGPSATADQLDLRGQLVFSGEQSTKSLPVSALLEDVPVPFVCAGSTRNPNCRVDSVAARELLSAALNGSGNRELSTKLDRIIEEKVPEPYQRAARGLLEIFSKSVLDNNERSDEEFLEFDDEF
ncbi:MAG: hypothetical protein AAGG11_23615 [Pseudomonadota bacterium]